MPQRPRPAALTAPPGVGLPPLRRRGIARLLRHRVIIPLLRSRHAPGHTARGVAAGLFFGLVPLPGLQTAIILVVWRALRDTRWSLSAVQALAWQWINNPVTMLPLYYLFYVTGHLLTGGGWAGGYGDFVALWRDTLLASPGWFDRLWHIASVLGWQALLGSLPWAAGAALAGYSWTHAILKRRVRQAPLAPLPASCEDLSGIRHNSGSTSS